MHWKLEPLVGWVGFADLRLSVGPGVFVPRQRTLHLLHLALSELRRTSGIHARTFVEAFAGVAPLATAVSTELHGVHVLACERDPAALRYATVNLAGRGTVYQTNVLNELPCAHRRDIAVIAAAPPYVPDGSARSARRSPRHGYPNG